MKYQYKKETFLCKIFSLLLWFLSMSISAQSQINWTAGINIATGAYGNMHPRVVIDGSGNPLVIWGRTSDESVFFSRWNGSSFTMPVKLNPSWLTVATQTWMGPDIASKGDTIYVVMKGTPEDTNHIYIVNSFDGGLSFSAPVRVDFITDSISRFPTVTTDSTGNPIVGFMKFNSSFGDARWVVAKSSDLGNTFSADVKASGWSGPGALVCDCCPGSIASEGNTVAMLYRDNLSDIRDSWTGFSTDGGVSFTKGWNVDQNNWLVMYCPASGPDGVIAGDSLYAVFMSEVSSTTRVFQSASSVNNGVAQPAKLLTGSIAGLTQQNYPRIDKHGNAVAIVWKQRVSGVDQLPILFTNDISKGFPSTYDTVDLSDITNADVALSNGNVFVVWQDVNSGTVKYRTGSYTPATTSVAEIKKYSFSVYPNPAATMITVISDIIPKGEIRITNTLGKEVLKLNLLENQTQLDIINLQSGFYLLTITSEGMEIHAGKLIVIK